MKARPDGVSPPLGVLRLNPIFWAKLAPTEALRRPPAYQLRGGPIVAEPSHAVFLSYASQDTEAAQKTCEALRAAGIEVFLDQSELRGGDVWNERIRREIHDCALFIPVISANTASRHEGYFRLEWDLADQRSHMMARSRVFVVPVCLDATTETAADVPESFRRRSGRAYPQARHRRRSLSAYGGCCRPKLLPQLGPQRAPCPVP